MRVDEGGVSLRAEGRLHGHDSWEGSLSLAFRSDRGGTQLARARHVGPLRVQRPFFPEGPGGACHVYVLHPPGGVVVGDTLTLDAALGSDARALLTAPGASKLYRARDRHADDLANGTPARVTQRFTVAPGAVCEFLPPETIVFDGTHAAVRTEVALEEGGVYAGWDILCLGRPAAGERFTRGTLRTELRIQRGAALAYLERGLYRGGDILLSEPWGLRGQPVLGLFVVAAPAATEEWVDAVRDVLDGQDHEPGDACSVSLVSGVLVVRYLGGSTRAARLLFERAFDVLRPRYAGRAAVHPRIWST